MKKQKMSLEKMTSVMKHVLSREEMKQIMAGSGHPTWCGTCPGGLPGEWPGDCYISQSGSCQCGGVGDYC